MKHAHVYRCNWLHPISAVTLWLWKTKITAPDAFSEGTCRFCSIGALDTTSSKLLVLCGITEYQYMSDRHYLTATVWQHLHHTDVRLAATVRSTVLVHAHPQHPFTPVFLRIANRLCSSTFNAISDLPPFILIVSLVSWLQTEHHAWMPEPVSSLWNLSLGLGIVPDF